MYCRKCGYEINENALFCPYCGAKTEEAKAESASSGPAPTKEANALARTALILSIISLGLPLYSGGIISCIAGIILGIISKMKLREYAEGNAPASGKARTAKTLSTVGIILNIVTIVLTILLLIALITFLSLALTYAIQQGGGEVVIDEANGIIVTIPEEWLQIFR